MAVTGTDAGDSGKDKARELPVDQLKDAFRDLGEAVMVRTLEKTSDRIEGLAQRLTSAADTGDGSGGSKAVTGIKAAIGAKNLVQGASPHNVKEKAKEKVKEKAKEKVQEAVGGGGGGGGADEAKAVTIIEEFDVGLPRRVAYDQWTQFADFPSFTSKVESVEQESDEKINWRARIFFSHRNWESTITEQVPDERIVWKSKGSKGYVDGAVTFHELAPTMTRVLLVAEYHPDGFFEKTANLWRAQGRRLRLDFKHIKRHMMTQTLLNQAEIEGWRGEIRDGEVAKTHEDAVKEEEDAAKGEEGTAEGEEDTAKGEEDTAKGEEETAESEEDTAKDEEETDKGEEDTAEGEEDTAKDESEDRAKADAHG